MDVIECLRVCMFVMENVFGLLISDEFVDIMFRVKFMGFILFNLMVLNIVDYGVFQIRK